MTNRARRVAAAIPIVWLGGRQPISGPAGGGEGRQARQGSQLLSSAVVTVGSSAVRCFCFCSIQAPGSRSRGRNLVWWAFDWPPIQWHAAVPPPGPKCSFALCAVLYLEAFFLSRFDPAPRQQSPRHQRSVRVLAAACLDLFPVLQSFPSSLSPPPPRDALTLTTHFSRLTSHSQSFV